jgi:hypothetical protein
MRESVYKHDLVIWARSRVIGRRAIQPHAASALSAIRHDQKERTRKSSSLPHCRAQPIARSPDISGASLALPWSSASDRYTRPRDRVVSAGCTAPSRRGTSQPEQRAELLGARVDDAKNWSGAGRDGEYLPIARDALKGMTASVVELDAAAGN